MSKFSFDKDGNLIVSASAGSSKNDFDFLVGKWEIHNKVLNGRLSNSNEWHEFEAIGELRKILQGTGNIDNFIATRNKKIFEGMSLRLFDPLTKLWSIYWADNNNGVLGTPVVGSFENNVGHFYCKDTLNGKDILVVYEWNKSDPAKPVWSQSYSPDNGKTWECNWYMYFKR